MVAVTAAGDDGTADVGRQVPLVERVTAAMAVVQFGPQGASSPVGLPMARVLAKVAVEAVHAYRDEHFGPGNDRVWGEGQWVRCDRCPDGAGFPSYHHRASHAARGDQ